MQQGRPAAFAGRMVLLGSSARARGCGQLIVVNVSIDDEGVAVRTIGADRRSGRRVTRVEFATKGRLPP